MCFTLERERRIEFLSTLPVQSQIQLNRISWTQLEKFWAQRSRLNITFFAMAYQTPRHLKWKRGYKAGDENKYRDQIRELIRE